MNTYFMKNFITSHIEADIKHKTYPELAFRFPPEPNGYLHLGHAKSIILNSFLAKKYNGRLYLRLDDTNPETENVDYVNGIIEDSKWLTLKDFDSITYTSDYFDKLYEAACLLIKKGLAYVDFSNESELKATRGGFTSSDIPTKYRDNSVEDNLAYFLAMKEGKYNEGEAILRAKINLSHKNMNMRDPVMYRIKMAHHHRTGNTWYTYPTYDFAHPLSDCIEKISHSLCSLEFEDHKVLYNWYVDNTFDLFAWKPVEIEFSRLEVEGVTLSKRKLLSLVNEKGISWDNPVMPTISGMRNKGITVDILYDYILKCGYTKVNATMESRLWSESIRTVLKKIERIFALIDPIELHFSNGKEHSEFSHIFIDKEDIRTPLEMEKETDFWRVYVDNWTRLKGAYNFKTLDISDKVTAEIDWNSHNLKECEIKPKVAIHWLDKNKSKTITARFYSPLFIDDLFNDNAVKEKKIMISGDYKTNTLYEFERIGYFYIDSNHIAHHLAWLKDSSK